MIGLMSCGKERCLGLTLLAVEVCLAACGGQSELPSAQANTSAGGTSGAGAVAGADGASSGGTAGTGGQFSAGGTAGAAGSGGSGAAGSGGADGGNGTAGTAPDGGVASDGGVTPDGSVGLDGSSGQVPKAGTIPIQRPVPSGCIDNVGPGERLVFDTCAQDVSFNVSVPDRCMERACGLVFDLHTLLYMDATSLERNTGLAKLGQSENYIVVQPNLRMNEPPGWYPVSTGVIAFLRLAMDVWNVEERRVHFSGFGHGGEVALRMRCELADVLASVATAMPAGVSNSTLTCGGAARYVDTLWIYGKNDPTAYLQDEMLAAFVDAYDFAVDRELANEQDYVWTRHRNGDGAVLEVLGHNYTTVPYAGFCIFGSQDSAAPMACRQPAPISQGRVVLDFFIAHPRRR